MVLLAPDGLGRLEILRIYQEWWQHSQNHERSDALWTEYDASY